MPTYTYRRADGTTFEHFQRMSDDALTADPETGQPVERLVGGGAGLIFKGSGFYLTDYARKNKAGGAEPTTESPTPAGEKKGGDASAKTNKSAKMDKSDAKPAAKPAASGT